MVTIPVMRLDKFLAQNMGFSRKDVKKLVRSGEVTIDGETVRDAATHIDDTMLVCVDGMPVEDTGTVYLMIHKPQGCVCANDDQTYPTVLSLLDLPRADELIICGRLDVDTTGLLLVTSDGKWAHRVSSPKHKTGKVYHVTTADPIPEEAEAEFEQGIQLKSELFKTKPARLTRLSDYEAEVELTEGRYHQVKRMFAALGNRVTELHRHSVGSIELDEMLEPGEYRFLTDEEVASING